MPVYAAIGHSTARWSIDTLHSELEAGVFIHSDTEFLGGGSWWIWHDQISPQGGKWDIFETDVDATQPDAVWLMAAPRDPAVFTGEPYLTIDEALEILTHARSITDDGGAIPYFISATPPYQSCSSVGSDQREMALSYARILRGESDCHAGPKLHPVHADLTYDLCHANDPHRLAQARILQEWFGAGGIAESFLP